MRSVAVVLALFAALGYGVGDFVGGMAGRRSHPALIPIAIQIIGIVVAVLAVLFGLGGSPTGSVLLWGAVSGIGSGIGNGALLRGLGRGEMSVVAPVSAVITAALPVLVSAVLGDRLPVLGWVGVGLALPAVALASWSGSAAGFRWADVVYGAVAGGGFGLLFIALDQAGAEAGAWPLVPGQVVALIVVAVAALPELMRLRRAGSPIQTGVILRWGGAAGLLGAAANILFLLATGTGTLAIVAVLAGLYPAVTVVLAAVFLHERPRPVQILGLVAAAASVVLIVTS